MNEKLRKACLDVLERTSGKQGFTAGTTHFQDLWARDALYASWGAKGTAHEKTGLRTLSMLRKSMSAQGQVPLRVGRLSMIKNLLGLRGKTGALYKNDKSKDPALDPNTLYLITAIKYGLEDESLRKAAAWLVERQQDDLLLEGSYASWDDALKKNSASLYNNVLYVHALEQLGRHLSDNRYAQQARRSKKALQQLWNGTFFDAWKGRQVMDVPGNLLSILLGVATKKQTTSILQHLSEQKKGTLPKTNYPDYPWKDTYYPFYLVGMADYHNSGPYWSWVAALEAWARSKNKEKQEAQRIHEKLLELFNEYGTIHEIYDEKLKPVKRLLYNSEKDFAWTAGIILATTGPT